MTAATLLSGGPDCLCIDEGNGVFVFVFLHAMQSTVSWSHSLVILSVCLLPGC